jgi:hypothetical protein
MSLPRFPAPLLELLRAFVSWRNVLNLTSVDKREAPMRKFWLLEHSLLKMSKVLPEDYNHWLPMMLVSQEVNVAMPMPLHPRCVELSLNLNVPLQQLRDATGAWPPLLTSLRLGSKFDRQLGNSLPPTLVKLWIEGKLGEEFFFNDTKWPSGLVELRLDAYDNMIFTLPPTLRSLDLSLSDFQWALPEALLRELTALENLELGNDFDFALPFLPPSLTSLKLGSLWNHDVSHLVLPNLRELVLPDHFSRSLDKFLTYATCLQKLHIGEHFRESLVTARLPDSLLTLKVESKHISLEHVQLPRFLRELRIETASPLPRLPDSLVLVSLSAYAGVLPPMPTSLRRLALSEWYDVDLRDALARSTRLVDVSLGCQSLAQAVLPDSIVRMSLENFVHDLSAVSLPTALQELRLYGNVAGDLTNVRWPPALCDLYIDGFVGPLPVLPSSLTSLQLGRFNSDLDSHTAWPTSLIALDLNEFNSELNSLPPHLQQLDLVSFDRPISIQLPASLTNLYVPALNHPLVEHNLCLCTNLRQLDFLKYNCALPPLPSSIETLTFGHSFAQPITELPSSLTNLSLPATFNQQDVRMPPKLKTIDFGREFTFPLPQLPPSCVTIDVPTVFVVAQIDNLAHVVWPQKLLTINVCSYGKRGRLKRELKERLRDAVPAHVELNF